MAESDNEQSLAYSGMNQPAAPTIQQKASKTKENPAGSSGWTHVSAMNGPHASDK
jgi:hypothetical protein